MMRLSVDQLRQKLNYNPETGVFIWVKPYHSHRIGMVAGRVNAKGYCVAKIGNRTCQLHQVAWMYVHGEWPKLALDHINGDKTDNRISNLRLATASQNTANQGCRPSKSGLKGAAWNKSLGRWQAQLKKDGRTIYLGLFDTAKEAHLAYCEAAHKFHGEFARVA